MWWFTFRLQVLVFVARCLGFRFDAHFRDGRVEPLTVPVRERS